MKIKIRKAKKEDIDAIAELNKKLFDFHRSFDKYYKSGSEYKKTFKKYLSSVIRKRGIKILVAEDDNKIIGYFIGTIERAWPFTIPKKIGKISDGFIEEKYRGLGIGREMFNELIHWFKKNKVKHVLIYVDERNKLGMKVWKRFKFKEFLKLMRLDL